MILILYLSFYFDPKGDFMKGNSQKENQIDTTKEEQINIPKEEQEAFAKDIFDLLQGFVDDADIDEEDFIQDE